MQWSRCAVSMSAVRSRRRSRPARSAARSRTHGRRRPRRDGRPHQRGAGHEAVPAVTNATGDYVLPNVTPDTYTVEVTMDGFKTLKRTGVAVSGGDRVAVGGLMLEVGGASETVDVTAEAPLIQAQSGERSFTVTTDAGREPADLQPQLRQPRRARRPASTGTTTRLGGGGQNNIMMDGISTMDTGNNGQMLQMNIDAIAEVKVLTSGLSGGVRPVERAADLGRHQERHQPVPRLGLRRRAQLRLEREQLGQHEERRPEDGLEATTTGATRSAGRSASRAATTSCSSSTATSTVRATSGGQRQPVPGADGARAGGRLLAVDRQQRRAHSTTSATLDRLPCSGTERAAASTAACRHGFRRAGCIRPALDNPEDLLADSRIARSRASTTTTRSTPPVTKTLTQQPAIRLDYQLSPALRVTGKYAGQTRSGEVNSIGRAADPGLQRHAPGNDYPFIRSTISMTVNYTLNPTTFLEATYGWMQNQLGSPLINAGLEPLQCRPRRSSRCCIPDAGLDRSALLRAQGARGVSDAVLRSDGRILLPPTFAWGNRVAQRAAEPRLSRVPEHQPHAGRLDQPDEGLGRHTLKAGFYLNHSYKAQNLGAGGGALVPGRDQFRATTPTIRSTPGSATPTPRSASSRATRSSRSSSRAATSTTTSSGTAGQLGVNNRLTLDYGLRFVNQQPQYDQYLQSSNFFPDRWSRRRRAGALRAGLRRQRQSRAPAATVRRGTR